MKTTVLAMLSIVILHSVAFAQPRVGAYYYPWYGDFPGGHVFQSTLRDHLIPAQSPAIGQYNCRNANVISEHIDQSQRGNIDLWALSWWGPTSAEDRTIRNHLLAHSRADELDFAIHYESTGRLGSFGSPDFSALVPDFRYLAQNYFERPNYLRIDGRPVVFIYLTRAYFNSQASRDAIVDVRQTMYDEFGCELYLVGDDFLIGGVNLQRARLWDAITDFDVYGTVLQRKGSTTAALNQLADCYDEARSYAHSLGVDFIPTASPGFNDRGVRTGHPAAPRYIVDTDVQEEGSLFLRMLTDVVVPRIDPGAGNILMINSFNEWHEDTQIEPTNVAPPTTLDDSGTQYFTEGCSYPGYGELYLDLLRQATTLSEPLPGDANRDNMVTDQDASILATNWQMQSGATWSHGDFNGDGKVADADAFILASHWQEGVEGVAAVPEPTSVVLLAGAVMSVLLWRVRRCLQPSNGMQPTPFSCPASATSPIRRGRPS